MFPSHMDIAGLREEQDQEDKLHPGPQPNTSSCWSLPQALWKLDQFSRSCLLTKEP